MNKRYIAFIIVSIFFSNVLVADQKKSDLNYSEELEKNSESFHCSVQRGIGTSPIIIKDKKEADHVKVVIHGVSKEIFEEESSSLFLLKIGSERIQVDFDTQHNELLISTFEERRIEAKKEQKEDPIGMLYSNRVRKQYFPLKSAIDLDQRKIVYDKKNQKLKIIIPRAKEQKKSAKNDQ